ncbi:unnamed protein product [Polarella glacialis]|uniref:2'-phosphotransferase n=1 Tax=Polarella glacialis TaxID=89957 RepID=A0A813KYP9_POLGL|nr:unnamed protein product [Polarella glacialis]
MHPLLLPHPAGALCLSPPGLDRQPQSAEDWSRLCMKDPVNTIPSRRPHVVETDIHRQNEEPLESDQLAAQQAVDQLCIAKVIDDDGSAQRVAVAPASSPAEDYGHPANPVVFAPSYATSEPQFGPSAREVLNQTVVEVANRAYAMGSAEAAAHGEHQRASQAALITNEAERSDCLKMSSSSASGSWDQQPAIAYDNEPDSGPEDTLQLSSSGANAHLDEFGGNSKLRDRWLQWGKVVRRKVMQLVDLNAYSIMQESADVSFTWHTLATGFLHPPFVNFNPLINAQLIAVGDPGLGLYNTKNKKLDCKTELSTKAESPKLDLVRVSGGGIIAITVKLREHLAKYRASATYVPLFGCATYFGNDFVNTKGKALENIPPEILAGLLDFKSVASQYDHFVIILGANAKLWGFEDIFDVHITTIRGIVRGFGILCVDGLPCCEKLLMKTTNAWLAQATQENKDLMADCLKACFLAAARAPPPIGWNPNLGGAAPVTPTKAKTATYKAPPEVLKPPGSGFVMPPPPPGPPPVKEPPARQPEQVVAKRPPAEEHPDFELAARQEMTDAMAASMPPGMAQPRAKPMSTPVPSGAKAPPGFKSEPAFLSGAKAPPEPSGQPPSSSSLSGAKAAPVPKLPKLRAFDLPQSMYSTQAVSKALSRYLRHECAARGDPIRLDGFVPIEQVLTFLQRDLRRNVSFNSLQAECACNPKRRFEMCATSGVISHIRCAQGHSDQRVDDLAIFGRDSLITIDSHPATLLHGSNWNALESIIQHELVPGGKRPGSRLHNHFAGFCYGDPRLVAGARFSAELAFYIDIEQVIRDGNVLNWAENDVILSKDVLDSRYVVGIRDTINATYVYKRGAILCFHCRRPTLRIPFKDLAEANDEDFEAQRAELNRINDSSVLMVREATGVTLPTIRPKTRVEVLRERGSGLRSQPARFVRLVSKKNARAYKHSYINWEDWYQYDNYFRIDMINKGCTSNSYRESLLIPKGPQHDPQWLRGRGPSAAHYNRGREFVGGRFVDNEEDAKDKSKGKAALPAASAGTLAIQAPRRVDTCGSKGSKGGGSKGSKAHRRMADRMPPPQFDAATVGFGGSSSAIQSRRLCKQKREEQGYSCDKSHSEPFRLCKRKREKSQREKSHAMGVIFADDVPL